MTEQKKQPSAEFVALARKSISPTNAAFDVIMPNIGAMVQQCKDPEQVLGIIQALFRTAIGIAYSSTNTRLDVLIRTEDDVKALAAAHWKANRELLEDFEKFLQTKGEDLPPHAQGLKQAIPDAGGTDEDFDATSMDRNEERQHLEKAHEAQNKPEGDATASVDDDEDFFNFTVNSRGGVS